MSKITKLAHGIGWGALSTIMMTVFQLFFMAIMARLLAPADFGLVAIANVCLRFFSYFAQMGTAPALIQKPDLEKGDIAAAFSVSLGISVIFFGLAQVCAPFIEQFFHIPELANVIRVLSLNFITGGFSAISVGLLRRNTKFRAIAIIDVLSYVLGYGIIGLCAANYGLGVWALVAAFMGQTTITAICSYAAARHPLSLKHSSAQRRHFFSYGGRYSVIGFMEFLSSSLDSLLIGKLLGDTPAGYYNRALLLANLPVQQPANILTKSLFPIMSAIGNEQSKQTYSLQLSSLLVGSYAFAVSLGINIAAPEIVTVLLGNKWLDAIPILQMLSWSIGPLYISHVAGVTLDSMNKLGTKFRIQSSMLLLLIALLLWIAPNARTLDFAKVIVFVEWVRVWVMVIQIMRILHTPIKDLVRIILCVFIISATCGFMITVAHRYFPVDIPIMIKLCAEIFSGFLGLVIGLLISRYIAVHLSAIRFLAERAPIFAKFLPKSA